MLDMHVAEFVSRRCGVPAADVEVSIRTVRGGLESQVARATVVLGAEAGSLSLPSRFMVKELRGWHRREAEIYRLVSRSIPVPPTVRILGEHTTADAAYLFMEEARGKRVWPWADLALATEVCTQLASLHDETCVPPGDWDYDRELRESAQETLDVALRARSPGGIRYWQRAGDLRYVVEALAIARDRLLTRGVTLIHGDVHPGNVVVASGAPRSRIVLLDWGRARLGSPLEDLAGWLHSVGCWEPEARRRHDTLLRAYFAARRQPLALDAPLREDYWLAAASNGLSGAIRYHLARMGDPLTPPRKRRDARWALQEWERVIRRARTIISASPAHRN